MVSQVTTVQPEAPPPRLKPSYAVRWGTWVARHKWWMLGVWAVLLVAAVLAYPHLLKNLSASDYSVTGSDSARVAQLIESDFTAAGSEQDVIAFDSNTLTVNDAQYKQVVNQVLAAVRDEPGVVALVGPFDAGAQSQISKDGHAALASLGLSGNDRERATRASDLQDVVASAAGKGAVAAYLTGYSPAANDLTKVETADTERAESIGLPIAFIVLLLALAAVIAAFVPLAMALVSLLLTFGVLSALVGVTNIDAFLLSSVTMIGVGISID